MKIHYYTGITNPSAAINLDANHFIVADDEDNILRIYTRHITSQPLQSLALSSIFKGAVIDGEDAEVDLEGATVIDDTLFWIGSHSTSRNAHKRPAREQLLAMTMTQDETGTFHAQPMGQPIKRILDELEQDKRFNKYHFAKARLIQSKSIGGLNIEGLSATPNKSLLIGFRNPLQGGKIKNDRLRKGKAIIVELLNPFASLKGEPPLFADPIELNLQGLSIRDICWYKKQKYLVVAGPYHDNIASAKHPRQKTQLFRWSKKSGKVKRFKKIDLQDLNIESAFFYPGENEVVQLLSDDGQLPEAKGFRSVTLRLKSIKPLKKHNLPAAN